MALRVLAPPLFVVFVFAGVYLTRDSQRSKLQGEIEKGRELLVSSASAGTPIRIDEGAENDSEMQRMQKEFKQTIADGHWKALAGEFIAMQNQTGGFNIQRAIALQSIFSELSEEELIQALDSISRADLTLQERAVLKAGVYQSLTLKDAALTLERIESDIAEADHQISWIAANAFTTLANKDFPAAQAWLSRMQQNGHLDSKRLDGGNQVRDQLYAAMVTHLLNRGAAETIAWLQTLPRSEVESTFTNGWQLQITEDNFGNYVEATRSVLERDVHLEFLGNAFSKVGSHEDFFAKARELEAAANFEPDEQKAFLEKGGQRFLEQAGWGTKEFTPEDLANLRNWAASSPEVDEREILISSFSPENLWHGNNVENLTAALLSLDAETPNQQLVEGLYAQLPERRRETFLQNLPEERRESVKASLPPAEEGEE